MSRVTAVFPCLFQVLICQFVADTRLSHHVLSVSRKRPRSRRVQSLDASVESRTTMAAKARLLYTGTRQWEKVLEFRSKLELFLTVTEGQYKRQIVKKQLFQWLLGTGFYFGQWMVKLLPVFCWILCKEWLWCSVVVFWLQYHFSRLQYWKMWRNQFITASQKWLRLHITCLKEQTVGFHKALGLFVVPFCSEYSPQHSRVPTPTGWCFCQFCSSSGVSLKKWQVLQGLLKGVITTGTSELSCFSYCATDQKPYRESKGKSLSQEQDHSQDLQGGSHWEMEVETLKGTFSFSSPFCCLKARSSWLGLPLLLAV